MCKYCEENSNESIILKGVTPSSSSPMTASINSIRKELAVSAVNWQMHSMPINYCPICGKKLNKE